MSYDIYLYGPEVKTAFLSGAELDKIENPLIPDDVRQRFADRLLNYDYELQSKNPTCTEYVHKNKDWSIQVAVFQTEIVFSVPYWNDAENAIFEALQTAHELADHDDLFVFNPQTGEWSD